MNALVERNAPFDRHLVRTAQIAVGVGTLKPDPGHSEAGAGENSQKSGNQLQRRGYWGRTDVPDSAT